MFNVRSELQQLCLRQALNPSTFNNTIVEVLHFIQYYIPQPAIEKLGFAQSHAELRDTHKKPT